MRLSHRLVALHVARHRDPDPGGAVERALDSARAQQAGAGVVRGAWSRRHRRRSAPRLRPWSGTIRSGTRPTQALLDRRPRLALQQHRQRSVTEIGTFDLIVFVDPADGAAFGWRRGLAAGGRDRPAADAAARADPARCSTIRPPPNVAPGRCSRSSRARPGSSAVARVTPVDGLPAGRAAGRCCRCRCTGMRLSDDRLAADRAATCWSTTWRSTDAPAAGKARHAADRLLRRDDRLRGLGPAAARRQHPAAGRAAARPGAAARRGRQRDQLALRRALGAQPRAGAASPRRRRTAARPSSCRTSATSCARR